MLHFSIYVSMFKSGVCLAQCTHDITVTTINLFTRNVKGNNFSGKTDKTGRSSAVRKGEGVRNVRGLSK